MLPWRQFLALTAHRTEGEKLLRRRFEEELQLAQATFDSPLAVIVVDALGFIERVNPAFTSMTGFSAEAVISRHMKMLRPSFYDDEFYRSLQQTLQHQNHWQGEEKLLKANGFYFPVRLTIPAIRHHLRRSVITSVLWMTSRSGARMSVRLSGWPITLI